MEITERLLNDAGGWQTMKQARGLHEMGRATGVTWEPPLLQGQVKEGEREFRSGLRILSRTKIENLCSCRASRQYGTICAHAIALGLEYLKPFAAKPAPPPAVAPLLERPARRPAQPEFSSEGGELVELGLVLPPNFVVAWQKGSIMVGVEALRAGQRTMLPALPKTGHFRAREYDLRLLDFLREISQEDAPGMLSLTREEFLRLLEIVPGHPLLSLGRSQKMMVQEQETRPSLQLEPTTEGAWRLRVAVPPGALPLLAGTRSWILTGHSFAPWATGLPRAYQPLLQDAQTLSAEQAAGFVTQELPSLRAYFEINEEALPSLIAQLPSTPQVSFALELEGSLNHLVCKLTALYGDRRLLLTQPLSRTAGARDLAGEQQAIDRLRHGGFAGPDAEGQFILKGETRTLAFFARDLPAWEKSGKVTIGSRFQHVTRDVERIQPRLEIRSSGESWFELQVELSSGSGERFSATEIQRLLQSGQSHVRRSNGKVTVFDPAMLAEFQRVLVDIQPNQRQPGLYQVNREHADYLEAVAAEHGMELLAPPKWRAALGGTRELAKLPPVPLGALEATLRPYQKDGVNWMNSLAHNGFSGILADEMGLGKTVQTLAALQHWGGRALIVCPSSLVFNWTREAARFTPRRQVLAIEGPDRRELFKTAMAEAELVVTSYALLRRDAELYRRIEFQTVVLDEAQHIKNPESQNAQAAFSMRSQHRFALTGTPVENSVRDLWSLMNFLMPGYLGSRTDFRDRYEVPITTTPGGPEHARLIKRLRPFLLRRRKQDVLAELPAKIEQVTFCELGRQQREMYTALLASARRQATEAAGAGNQNKARLQVLTALLRLRQACCDVRLLQPDASGEMDDLSGKLEALSELLLEAVDGGHRVLVFSQFVSMLALLRGFLEEQELSYCYLDGSTKDRAAVVDRFQTGEVSVFLISLKAGGVGLNLTAADTVVHFDPWWNPAVEAQATDRAHRIGQKKSVTSYKLIARNTIEEKILTLQQKKRAVIEATLESEEPLMQGLSMAELRDLLD